MVGVVVGVVDVVLVGVVVGVVKQGNELNPWVAVIVAMVDAKATESPDAQATLTSPSFDSNAMASCRFALTASSSSGTNPIVAPMNSIKAPGGGTNASFNSSCLKESTFNVRPSEMVMTTTGAA